MNVTHRWTNFIMLLSIATRTKPASSHLGLLPVSGTDRLSAAGATLYLQANIQTSALILLLLFFYFNFSSSILAHKKQNSSFKSSFVKNHLHLFVHLTTLFRARQTSWSHQKIKNTIESSNVISTFRWRLLNGNKTRGFNIIITLFVALHLVSGFNNKQREFFQPTLINMMVTKYREAYCIFIEHKKKYRD